MSQQADNMNSFLELFREQKYVSMAVILGVCFLVLFLIFFRNRAMWLVNCMLRMAVGALTIYLCNMWMDERHILGKVGLNPISLLTSALLGIPGVAGLYGIRFFLSL